MAVRQFEERRSGPVPFQLRGDQGAAAERVGAAAPAHRRRRRALRLRARATRRPALLHRRHHPSQIHNQRRVVFRRVQRTERTIPH